MVLCSDSSTTLEELADQASQLLLPTYLVSCHCRWCAPWMWQDTPPWREHSTWCVQVSDAGKTEVVPGSVTVLGVAGPSETVDKITGQLQTLR